MALRGRRLQVFRTVLMIEASAFILCGAAQWIGWHWLRIVPCASNHMIYFKGMAKCVPQAGFVLWQCGEYGVRAALTALLITALVSKISDARSS